MNNKLLYNQKNKAQCEEDLGKESLKIITLSFYKYVELSDIENLRDELFVKFNEIGILGRVYIASEGINAQISIPEHNLNSFKKIIFSFKEFEKIELKIAVIEGTSFLKLTIKLKQEIVAYKIAIDEYNINNYPKYVK